MITSKIMGVGAPIVLLHAFPLSYQLWEKLSPPKGYSLIYPDFPGFGYSALAKNGFSLAEAALELRNNLEEQGITEPIVLGGISMGGYWALEFIRQFPEKVKKLVLVSTKAGLDKPEAKQRRLEMADRVLKEGTDFLIQAIVPGLLGKSTLEKQLDVVEKLKNWIRQTRPQAIALAQRAMAQRRDQTELLGKIKIKTLVMAGNEDALIPISESENMAREIPNSLLVIFQAVGHLIPLENFEKFQNALNDFLSRQV